MNGRQSKVRQSANHTSNDWISLYKRLTKTEKGEFLATATSQKFGAAEKHYSKVTVRSWISYQRKTPFAFAQWATPHLQQVYAEMAELQLTD